MRLAKFLASAGIASRRAAEELIRGGRVTVGGVSASDPALDVGPQDLVCVDGQAVGGMPERVVYALNKPAGVVSTARDPQGRPTVVSLIPSPVRLYPVGRLDIDYVIVSAVSGAMDIDSMGLILLTNDGELAHRLTHPSFEVEKTYRAVVGRGPVKEAALKALRDGVVLDDGRTSPARVRRLSADALEITIHEGRKRQVKRMCEHAGHPVKRLERIRFGPLELGELRLGAYRKLTAAEVERLVEASV